MAPNISSLRHGAARIALTLVVSAMAATPASAQQAGAANQQRFLGKWKLDPARSKYLHAADVKSNQWRLYEPDGNRVKVSWGNESGPSGTYSAKCDRSVESASVGNIRCWQANLNVIEGEQLDSNDPLHTHYRRVLSHKGKIMSIIWYADAKRRRVLDRFVYTKQ
jgi:hypothetical protein